MSSLELYSDEALLTRTKTLVARERKITLMLIETLREIDSRMLYSGLGYSSLWEFCTQYLGLSEGASQRRISAMRLTREVPKVAQAIETGSLSLSNVAKLQSFFNAEKKSGNPYSTESKNEIIQSMEGLSQKECDLKLAEISPRFEATQKESVKPVSQDQSLLRVVLDSKTLEKLNELKSRLAHQLPNASYADLIAHLVEERIQQIEIKMKPRKTCTPKAPKLSTQPKAAETVTLESVDEDSTAVRITSEGTTSAEIGVSSPVEVTATANVAARAKVETTNHTSNQVKSAPGRESIDIGTKRQLWERSQGRCEFVAPDGRRCNSIHSLQIEHLVPVAAGGNNELCNLEYLCRSHNLYRAQQYFGREWMAQFVPRIK